MGGTWSSTELFRLYVLQQQEMVMIHLGKVSHPVTGKIERDLDAARFGIDMLAMMEERTKGNLTPDEDRLLGQILTNLRLNFVDEAARTPETGAEQDAGKKPPETAEKDAGKTPPGTGAEQDVGTKPPESGAEDAGSTTADTGADREAGPNVPGDSAAKEGPSATGKDGSA